MNYISKEEEKKKNHKIGIGAGISRNKIVSR